MSTRERYTLFICIGNSSYTRSNISVTDISLEMCVEDEIIDGSPHMHTIIEGSINEILLVQDLHI
jgi:hypothetical protein